MNRDPKKKAYIRRKLKNNFWQELSAEHKAGYKNMKKCVKIRKKLIKAYLNKLSQSSIERNKGI